MNSKLIIFLVLLNLVTTLTVGYTIYTNVSKEYNITVEASSLPEDSEDLEDKQFKIDVYNALSNLILGQNYLNVGLLRIHHYTEPHADKFYDNCPECELEKQQILKEEKDNFTFNVEGL